MVELKYEFKSDILLIFIPNCLYMSLVNGSQSSIGRNNDCPCGSGKKYKRCCLNKGGGNVVSNESVPKQQTKMDKFFSNYREHLYSVDKLYSIKSSYSDDTEFFDKFFFYLWAKFGNQHIHNFDKVWKWASNLKIEKGRIRTLDVKVGLIPLFRCMTLEEFNSMKDGSIKSPSWTTNYQDVTHFKNHQIQTKSTLKSVITFSLFDYDDILHISNKSEGECFMKFNSKPKDTQILVEWGVEDVERLYGHPIESLYVSHLECGNGFEKIVETLLKRGLELKGWFKGEDNVWYSETDHKIKDGFEKIDEIIKKWINQFSDNLE
jgi:hypothetical protein